MKALLLKEIRSFLSSLIGYIVMAIFLLMISLFMWVFPGEYNTLESGFANIDTLFLIAPWVFMFLIPAITMRSFSEERRTGTIEMLLTRPITDFQIVFAKYVGGLVLVAISLIPTLLFFATIYYLGDPVGNIDTGATWGSYIGLLFLGSAYVSIGIFASSITPNQVVSFLVAIILSFFMFIGFDSIGSFNWFGDLDTFIINLGLNEHYKSLRRGVVDSRDVIYIVVVSLFFLFSTRLILQSRRW
ncbi:MAG: gliding motility-associated ABC transporter permease subunit GldF [Cryomorphaceae bacterium]|jgi:ABC-2 type transport system permease protein|nr:gliding motility-associated ABC transporter permease subunit GldF [Cryomorphaceae bacterium]